MTASPGVRRILGIDPGLRVTGFGILELRLHDASYDWKYVAVDGSVIDSGSAACH